MENIFEQALKKVVGILEDEKIDYINDYSEKIIKYPHVLALM